jgi:hypothetical protein
MVNAAERNRELGIFRNGAGDPQFPFFEKVYVQGFDFGECRERRPLY